MTEISDRDRQGVPTIAEDAGLLANWRYALATGNPGPGRLDVVSKWIILTRFQVLPMTITAGLVAGLLAVHHPEFHWGWFGLAFVGIVLAHVSNNLMNDLFDSTTGLDTDDYPRALYAPHPILSGWISKGGLAAAALAVNVVDLGVAVTLFVARGWPILVFAVGGFLLSAAYTAPPFRLKKRGLGEPDVLVVWGPMMVGGTYYAATGDFSWLVVLASLPYGLLCTSVLMGKHIDKLPWDEAEGIRTLPVILGAPAARRATQGLFVAFYLLVVGCVAGGVLPWPSLLTVLAIPGARRAWQTIGAPKPDAPPEGYPIWPLWYVAFAFLHTRRAGALLVLGMIAAAVAGIEPPALF